MKNLFCGTLIGVFAVMLVGSTADSYGIRGEKALEAFCGATCEKDRDCIDISDPNAVIAVSKQANPELYQKLMENVLSSASPDYSTDGSGYYIRLESIKNLECEGASLLDGVHNGTYIVFCDEDARVLDPDYCKVTRRKYVKFAECYLPDENVRDITYDYLIRSATRFPDGSLHISIDELREVLNKINSIYGEDMMSYNDTVDCVKPGNYIKHRSDIIYIDE